MPSATTASFDEGLLPDRMCTYMNNHVDYAVGLNSSGVNNRSSYNGLNNVGLTPIGNHQKMLVSFEKDKVNPVTCNSPIQPGASGFGIISSPHLMGKYHHQQQGGSSSGGLICSAFNTPNPGSKVMMEEYHSLQNSPFYNHYPTNHNGSSGMKRQNDSLILSAGVMEYQQQQQQQSAIHSRRPPQRELFPQMALQRTCDSNGWTPAFSTATATPQPLVLQDRIYYSSVAQKQGFIVGTELERIKENSRRSTSHSYGRISAHFRNRYGETEAKTKAAYMQLGVRVPSKDHVSEIVGKGGQKIKLIREETGALITTPGEHEDHVFIIEAPPEIALKVATLISTRAAEITQSKMSASERRRGSTNSLPNNCVSLFASASGAGSSNNGSRVLSHSPDDFQNVSMPSPAPLLKGPLNSMAASSGDSVFTFNGNIANLNGSSGINGSGNVCGGGGGGANGGRILLARSKISVPQDMVGKIIGTQGSIITTIQKDTGTEIKSPPKEAARGPSATSEFEISAYQSQGMSSIQMAELRVQQAKQLIGHLVMRQFERRASEESEDTSGGSSSASKSRKNSAGDDNDDSTGKSGPSKPVWMWPDVTQMDADEAREVLDRILAESKSKTRRPKEVSVIPNGAGSLPASPCCGNPNGGAYSAGTVGAVEFFAADKVGSCHNSPYHQARFVAQNQVFQNPTIGPALMNGYLGDRRLASNVDYHPDAVFVDGHHLNHQQHLQQQHHSSLDAFGASFWLNSASSTSNGPRHASFSAGMSNGVSIGASTVNCSPNMLRRNTMASPGLSSSHRHNSNSNTAYLSSTATDSGAAFDIMDSLNSLCLGSDDPPGFGLDSTVDAAPRSVFSFAASESSVWPAPKSIFTDSSPSGFDEDSERNVLRKIWDTPIFNQGSLVSETAVVSEVAGSGNPHHCGAIGEGRRRASPSNNEENKNGKMGGDTTSTATSIAEASSIAAL